PPRRRVTPAPSNSSVSICSPLRGQRLWHVGPGQPATAHSPSRGSAADALRYMSSFLLCSCSPRLAILTRTVRSAPTKSTGRPIPGQMVTRSLPGPPAPAATSRSPGSPVTARSHPLPHEHSPPAGRGAVWSPTPSPDNHSTSGIRDIAPPLHQSTTSELVTSPAYSLAAARLRVRASWTTLGPGSLTAPGAAPMPTTSVHCACEITR